LSSAIPSVPTNVTLGQLIALNDEILALTYCGVPLEQGLAELGRDLPGRLGRISTSIAARLEQGTSLADVLADTEGEFPSVYRAVIQAGVRSGRLSVALEGLATSTRRVAEVRRLVGLALIYPLLVLTLACVLCACIVPTLTDHLALACQANDVPLYPSLNVATSLGGGYWRWILAVPVLAISLTLAWWWRSRRAATVQSARAGRFTFLLPTVGRMIRTGRTATFLEILALLVEQQVSLIEALRLAGQASGDARLSASANRLADTIERGGRNEEAPGRRSAIPPLVRWRILNPGTQEQLRLSLRHASDTYSRRTKQLVDWLTLYLPLLLTVVIGGTTVVLYALLVMGPWFAFLMEMGRGL
jgi:general secretion pathway protein F